MRLSSNRATPEHSHLLLDLLYPPYCLYVFLGDDTEQQIQRQRAVASATLLGRQIVTVVTDGASSARIRNWAIG